MTEQEKIKELEERLKNSVTLEDVLTIRVYKDSIEIIKRWAGGYLIIVTIVLAAFGYSTIKDIDKAVKEFSKEKVEVQLKSELDSLKFKTVSSIKKNSINYTTELDKDLAKIFDETKRNFEMQVQNFAIQTSKELNKPELAKSIVESTKVKKKQKGFAFYGIYYNNAWNERNFKNLNGNPTKFPQADDVLEAVIPINSREGVIQFSESEGWQNQRLISSISIGEQVKVLQVHRVAGGAYIWIKFEK